MESSKKESRENVSFRQEGTCTFCLGERKKVATVALDYSDRKLSLVLSLKEREETKRKD